MNTNESTGNQPEKKFRAGVISATVWLNQTKNPKGEPVSYRTISLQRGYKDKNNQWQNTNSLRINDLPKAALMLNQAFEYLVTKQQDDSITVQEEIIM